MSGETEAAGDILTGGIIAGTVEGTSGQARVDDEPRGACPNCGAALVGAYCHACGQPSHLHRSLLSIGHDIVHGVFHFEGKIWRTLPELMFRPGRLTRRYIDGERAKFVSPMALFLFSVFLMFAVFSITGVLGAGGFDTDPLEIASEWKSGNQTAIDTTTQQIDELRAQLVEEDLTPTQKTEIEEQIAGLESSRAVMEALAKGDFAALSKIKEEENARQASAPANQSTVWPPPGSRLQRGIEQIQDNPKLLLYKLKTNAYKFSWALIPLSVPFLWLMFFWRRDVHLYDHAIFATYSITFMMLFVVLLSLLATAGVGAAIWGTALAFIPPIHMYKQLRGTYGLSRFGAAVRLFFLLIAITIVLSLFSVLLTILGMLD
jgi:hypothetical protein